MSKILFVCLGNICRSPMAEFIMKDIINKQGISNIQVDSCATCYDEIGNDTYKYAKEVLDNHNVTYTPRKARILTKEDYDKYDYIIAMEDSNIERINKILQRQDTENKIHRLLDYTDEPRDIEDPWYTGRFEKVFNEINLGCEKLLEQINEVENIRLKRR